jgi:hypothetical protein
MDGEQDQHPAAEPTAQLAAADAERRVLAQLAGRRQLVASIVSRLRPRPGLARGLALGGQRPIGIGVPLAVPHLLNVPNHLRREVDWGAPERFWAQRLAPHRAMLHRRRPLVGSALLPPSGRAVEPVDALAPLAPERWSSTTAGMVQIQDPIPQPQPAQPQPAQPQPARRVEPGLGTPASGVASAVWRRLAAVLLPTRAVGPRRTASTAPATAQTNPPESVRGAPETAQPVSHASSDGAPAVAHTFPYAATDSEPAAAQRIPQPGSDEPAAAQSAAHESSLDEPAAAQSAAHESSLGESAMAQSAAHESSLGESAAAQSAPHESSLAESAVAQSAAHESSLGKSAMAQRAPHESGPGGPSALQTGPGQSGSSELARAQAATLTVPPASRVGALSGAFGGRREAALGEPAAAQGLAEGFARTAAWPGDEPRGPADEIAPLASRLTRRLAAPIGMLARAAQRAHAAPTRLFWWPGAPTVVMPPASAAPGRFTSEPRLRLRLGAPAGGPATGELALGTSRDAGEGEGRAWAADTTTPRRATPSVRAPGLLGSVLEVHRAATTPTRRRVPFMDHVQHAQRFAAAGGADANRWRVRSALTSPGPPTGAVHVTAAADRASEPPPQLPGEELIQAPAAQHVPTTPSPPAEPGGFQNPQTDPSGLNTGRSQRPLPASAHAQTVGASVTRLPVVGGLVHRLMLGRPPTAPEPADQPALPTASAPPAERPSGAVSQPVPGGTARQYQRPSTDEPAAPDDSTPSQPPGRGAQAHEAGLTSPVEQTNPPPPAARLFQRMRRQLLAPPATSQPPLAPREVSTPVLAPPPAAPNAPARTPHLLPERPSDRSDTELADLLRRLPAPMAAAALAAGVLGDSAGQAALERSGQAAPRTLTPPPPGPAQTSRTTYATTPHPVLAPPASAPRPIASTAAFTSPGAAQTSAWPAKRPLDATDAGAETEGSASPFEASEASFEPRVAWSSAAPDAMTLAPSPSAVHAMSERAWSAPVATHHAPLITHVPSPGSSGGGAASALAAGGFSAAPIERAVEPVAAAASGPAPAAHPVGGGEHPSPGTAAAPPEAARDLDRLAEEVLDKLRWRLAVERERLMG